MTRAAWLIASVAGCANAAAQGAPGPGPRTAESPPPPVANRGACHRDPDEILPPDRVTGGVSFRDGARVHTGAYQVCDTPDTVVLVQAKATATADSKVTRLSGSIVAFARTHVDRPRHAAIGKGSTCFDECNGPGGGHAGCSETGGCTMESRLADARVVHFGPDGRFVGDGKVTAACGPEARGNAFAMCSTVSRLAVVDWSVCDQQRGLGRLHVEIYEHGQIRGGEDTAAAPTFTQEGDLDVAWSHGDVWTYRFPAPAGGRDVALSFVLGAQPSATLQVGGVSEACFVFSLAARGP